jgi:ABC-type uncharacterized transport system permease subunit
MEGSLLSITIITWLAMSVRMAVPLLFTGLGGLISQKAGIFNFALEGMMLSGAFFAYYGTLVSGSPWIGLLLAILAGILTGLLLAYTSVTLGVSQLVVGIGIGIFSLGLTSYLYRLIDTGGQSAVIQNFPILKLPVLSDLPVLGPILFNHSFLVYVGLLLVVVIAWFFNHTTTGLNLRAVGERPEVADTAGINVYQYRYFATIVSGMLTQVTRFLENLTAGRGWIALAAIILGKYNPWGVLAACLLFGAADALQMQLQILAVKIPYQILLMTPYIMAMLALGGVVGKVRGPAAQGKPYLK